MDAERRERRLSDVKVKYEDDGDGSASEEPEIRKLETITRRRDVD